MIYRKLGQSGFDVSSLSFGLWQIGDSEYWGENDTGAQAIHAAIDGGVNLFDTAEVYGDGDSERVFGKWIGPNRDSVLIATKVSMSHCGVNDVRKACEGSLTRLNTDRIDLYQVHWPNHDIPFSETYAELTALRDEGKIRAIGVSNFGVADLGDWLSVGEAASNQMCYNPLFRAIEIDVLPQCKKHDVGVLTYSPLMQGILSGRYSSVEEIPPVRRRTRHFSSNHELVRHGEPGHEELTINTLRDLKELSDGAGIQLPDMTTAWILAQPGVASVIIGSSKPDQVRRSMEASRLKLPGDITERFNEITRPLKEALGPVPDMWVGGENARIR